MANLAYLQLTRQCVQSCLFCSNPPTGSELSEEQLVACLDRFKAMAYDGVILTGGEPTLSPLLIPALREAARRGLACRVITNGQLLADEELFLRCLEAGLNHLHLSLYSYRPEVHDFIAQSPGSWQRAITCLEHAARLCVAVDLNTVINAYNSDHLHETVIWICDRFPSVRHFVWNNLDPEGERVQENPDSIPRLREFMIPLELAMEYLDLKGRTFRAERVPLCAMPRFAWASTETRKIVKGEERSVHFLDRKGFVRQQSFDHDKGKVCPACSFDPICAGLYSLGRSYDEAELAPVFDDPVPVLGRILRTTRSPDLLRRLRRNANKSIGREDTG